MELLMHLGGLLSTYASFVLSNLPCASITPWLHAARLKYDFLSNRTSRRTIQVIRLDLRSRPISNYSLDYFPNYTPLSPITITC